MQSMIFLYTTITLNILLIIILLVLIWKQFHKAPQTEEHTELSSSTDKSILEIGYTIIEHSSEAFSNKSAMVRLLDFINTTLIRLTVADGATILLVDDFEDLLTVKAYSGEFPPPYKLPTELLHKENQIETYFRNTHFTFTDNIFGAIVKSGQAELVLNPNADKRLYKNILNEHIASPNSDKPHKLIQSDFLQASSYIFIPLKLKDNVIGIVALARKKNSLAFTIENFKIAQGISNFASIAIKNIYSFQEVTDYRDLTRDANIATKIQSALYLKKLPVVPHLSIGNFFYAVEGVCGDYFDIIHSRKDRISFFLADVPGKGMTSLIIMSMIRAIMRVIVNTTQSAGTILSWTNRGIAPEKAVDHYASAALLNYDPTTKTIQFATAGTTPILYFSAKQGLWNQISLESEPIGVEKTTEYSDHSLKLAENDILVLYTDGLIEGIDDNGNQYSTDRLKKMITKHALLKGNEIATKVKNDLQQFTGSMTQHDDQSLLIIKMQ